MKTLADRLFKALGSRDKSPADLARAIGKTESAISQWLSGETKSMRSDNLMAVSGFLRCNAQWLVTGVGVSGLDGDPGKTEPIELENNPLYPAIRRVHLKAQAGVTGYAVEYIQGSDGDPIVFRANWYKVKGYKPEKLFAVKVLGQSMRPKYSEGDIVVINTENNTPKDGLIYLVNYEGEFTLKRLVRDAGEWWLSSDNPDQRRHPRKLCNEHTDVVGKVVYQQTDNTDD